jgi:2-polyprenyl-3-methyl-5-hydroxy-6-metoxy-1,4-benzoquinol methylase
MLPGCPLCREKRSEPVFRMRVPLFFNVAAAAGDTGRAYEMLSLVRCGNCRHLYNEAFDPPLAEAMYRDQPLTNVPVDASMFDRLHELLDWLPRGALDQKNVLEIGGGAGALARLLARRARHVTLFEPSSSLHKGMLPEDNISLINGFWPVDGGGLTVDLVLCRQVLEHLEDPLATMSGIAGGLAEGGYAYLEVPSLEFIEAYGAFTDVHIQHVQYFTKSTFIAAARSVGLVAEAVLDIKDGHDFGVLFRRGVAAPLLPNPTRAPALGPALLERIEAAKTAVAMLPPLLVLYGATPHAQMFLNGLDDVPPIMAVIDDNAQNHARALYSRAGLHPVSAPNSATLPADGCVLITAYLHDMAIGQKLRAGGFKGRIVTMRPQPLPSNPLGMEWLYASQLLK